RGQARREGPDRRLPAARRAAPDVRALSDAAAAVERQLDMIQEANHTTRLVYIDQPPVDDPDDPKWLGDSVGHWDGNTLVVDTINNDHRTWLDKAGLPHSDAMKVTERLSLSNGGKVLTDAITIDDPKTYTAPWTTTVKFNREPGMELAENVCTRDHRM